MLEDKTMKIWSLLLLTTSSSLQMIKAEDRHLQVAIRSLTKAKNPITLGPFGLKKKPFKTELRKNKRWSKFKPFKYKITVKRKIRTIFRNQAQTNRFWTIKFIINHLKYFSKKLIIPVISLRSQTVKVVVEAVVWDPPAQIFSSMKYMIIWKHRQVSLVKGIQFYKLL